MFPMFDPSLFQNVFLFNMEGVDYFDASPEEEAIEVGDGEVRRPVAEAEAPAGLQWANDAIRCHANLMASRS